MKYLALFLALITPCFSATSLQLFFYQQHLTNPTLVTSYRPGFSVPSLTGDAGKTLLWVPQVGTLGQPGYVEAHFEMAWQGTGIAFDATTKTNGVSTSWLNTQMDSWMANPSGPVAVEVAAMEAEIAGKAAISYVDAGLAGKMNTLIGSASQYLAGNGALITFPSIPTVPTDLGAFTNSPGFITSSSLTWPNISGKPVTFTPSAHTHSISEVDGLSLVLADKADTSTVNTGLALKSNVSDVSAGLALKVDKAAGKGLSSEDYTTAEKTKLAGVQAGATQNSADASLRDRSTHTGSQAQSTVTNLVSDLATINANVGTKADSAITATAIATKEPAIATGGSGKYWDGNKTWQNFPTIPAAQVQSDWNASSGLGVILNKPSISTKRRETYTVTTNASGVGTVTFGTAFAVAPSISAEPTSFTSDNQFCRVTSITTTGFTVTCRLRTDVIGLLPSFSNISGATVEVLITEK